MSKFYYYYAEYRYVQFHYKEGRNAEGCYDWCRYDECRGGHMLNLFKYGARNFVLTVGLVQLTYVY